MAVPLPDRGENELEVFTVLDDMVTYFWKVLSNEKKFPEDKIDPQILIRMRENIIYADECVHAANAIYFNKGHIDDYGIRHAKQLLAKQALVSFETDARACRILYGVKPKRYHTWEDKIKKAMDSLTAWITGDQNTYRAGKHAIKKQAEIKNNQ